MHHSDVRHWSHGTRANWHAHAHSNTFPTVAAWFFNQLKVSLYNVYTNQANSLVLWFKSQLVCVEF